MGVAGGGGTLQHRLGLGRPTIIMILMSMACTAASGGNGTSSHSSENGHVAHERPAANAGREAEPAHSGAQARSRPAAIVVPAGSVSVRAAACACQEAPGGGDAHSSYSGSGG